MFSAGRDPFGEKAVNQLGAQRPVVIIADHIAGRDVKRFVTNRPLRSELVDKRFQPNGVSFPLRTSMSVSP